MEAELSIGHGAIAAYSRLSYTMWFALAEFVDNSTQSRLNYGSLVDDVLRAEGQPLTVNITHNRLTQEISIEDNSIGMSVQTLIEALRIAQPTKDSVGRSRYGMGMKTAACWIGRKWKVTTCLWDHGEEWTADVDVDAIASGNNVVPLTSRAVDRNSHYTRITIRDLRRRIQQRSEETIKQFLGSIYMFDLRPDANGNVALKLTYNGEEITPPDVSDWDTDPSGNLMRRDLPELKIGEKTITGWIGVLRRGGRKYGGFSLFQNKRQIQGFPNAWKPKAIFGGVDDEGANNLVAQRLTGVLELDGFAVSHTKDAILFEGDEEEQLDRFLVTETKNYAEYAKSRRGSATRHKWTREQIRDLVSDLQKEFVSDEIKDALTSVTLPPAEAISASNQQQLRSLTAEDEIGRLEILPDLSVVVSLKEISEWEPYVTFVTGADEKTLHVIINGLHPYYQTLVAKDSIDECVQQYLFDAVAEFKAGKLTARLSPDCVRRIKNELLLARSRQIENADAEVRARAEAALNESQQQSD